MPATASKVNRRKPPGPEKPVRAAGIREWIKQFLTLKAEVETLEQRRNDLKERCRSVVNEQGAEDDKGSLFLEFDPPIKVGAVTCTGIKNERRITTVIDEESATEFFERLGLLKKVQTTVVVLDQDKIMALLYKGEITEADLDKHVFQKNETWAFKPLTTGAR